HRHAQNRKGNARQARELPVFQLWLNQGVDLLHVLDRSLCKIQCEAVHLQIPSLCCSFDDLIDILVGKCFFKKQTERVLSGLMSFCAHVLSFPALCRRHKTWSMLFSNSCYP